MRTMVWGLVLAGLLVGCDGSTLELHEFEQPIDGAVPLRADGEACSVDSQCEHSACVPVLPAQVEERGVCWGPDFPSCLWVLFEDGVWSKDPCRDLGLTDMLCPPTMTPAMQEACVIPDVQPTGDYPYDYICCETTFTE